MINDSDAELRWLANFYRRGNALMSYFLHIPFPEQLDDDTWHEKWQQIVWLSESGVLGVKKETGNAS